MSSRESFRRFVRQSVHYGLIGLVGLGVNFAVFHLALLAGFSPTDSNFRAIVVSILVNFVIAIRTRLVLPKSGWRSHLLKLGHWASCSVAGIAANTGVFVSTLNILGNTNANILATIVGMGVSYAMAIITRLFPIC